MAVLTSPTAFGGVRLGQHRLNNLGLLESRQTRDHEAVRYFRMSFDMRRELLRADHPSTLLSQANLAAVLGRVDRLTEAEAMLWTRGAHGKVLQQPGQSPDPHGLRVRIRKGGR